MPILVLLIVLKLKKIAQPSRTVRDVWKLLKLRELKVSYLGSENFQYITYTN